MLEIKAIQVVNYPDHGGLQEQEVGVFMVDPNLPPYQPQKVSFGDVWAWVAHDGQGKVAGFPIGNGWEAENENPQEQLRREGSFTYVFPEDPEAYITIT